MTNPRQAPKVKLAVAALSHLHTMYAVFNVTYRRFVGHKLVGPDSVPEFMADTALLPLALDLYIKAARLLRPPLGNQAGDFDTALAELERKAPEVGAMRDVLSHFDAYALGKGWLAKGLESGVAIEVGAGNETITVRLVDREFRLEIPAIEAAAAHVLEVGQRTVFRLLPDE